ncbi:hypothetical protein SAMN00120144_3417 [Hymenobacter roseosalivarius DSM 11622]|uniref:DUF1735 domain-containing protein n=1 Tax=Hymenobacter roseosalivarius DSM 11622 TaxID=645990 RepID=A0A1W1UVF7_9BACT|nr:hypothetical protein [Hymenobacter roseosalivarius]SMB84694.1 hypothetical protein SAMN00120144_3417 [Hymenobacter roseosalivarius DSM 11622]
MKKQLIHILALLLLSATTFSCEKEYDDKTLGPLEDSIADIPVTVPNQEFFERFPIVTAKEPRAATATAPAETGAFTIILEIPADKGKIREISKITTGTAGLANMAGADALAYNYNATSRTIVPILGNGTNQITFSSNLNTYNAYRTRVGAGTAGQPGLVAPNSSFTAQNPNQLPFYFLLTLEDGKQIIPTAVRVRVVQ